MGSLLYRWVGGAILVLALIAGAFGAGAAVAMGNTAGTAGGAGAASFLGGMDKFFESFKSTNEMAKTPPPATNG